MNSRNDSDTRLATEPAPETGYLAGAGLSSDSPADYATASPARGSGDPYNAEATSTAASHGDRLDPRFEHHGPREAASPVREGLGAGAWIGVAVVVLLLAAAILFGILSREHAEHTLEETTVRAAVPIVSVTYPSGNRIASELSLPGATQAYVDTPIYSRTNGYLKQWFFDIGAHVKKGQLMATIETPEVDQQLQVAEADLKASQANLDLANITSGRYQNLLKSNSVSKQETDQAIGNAAAKQAAVEASMAAVRRLQQLQSFEKIYAPFDGIVTARNTDVGDLIVAGQEGTGGNARELFHLASIERLRVFVPVPESDMAAIHDGEHAFLTSDADPGRTFDGVIARNANAVDPASRTLNVEVDVNNADRTLLPGAYVFVHFKLPNEGQYLTIPSNTLIFRSQGLQVGVVRQSGGVDRAQLVRVTIAHDGGALVEISSGLTPNDAIILDPSDSLANGQQVRIANSKGKK
jgi:RND family efflux transporter MFP subunit